MEPVEIVRNIDAIADRIHTHQAAVDERVDDIERRLNRVSKAGQAPDRVDMPARAPHRYSAPPALINAKTGEPVIAVSHRQNLTEALYGAALAKGQKDGRGDKMKLSELPSIGRVLRGIVLGGNASDHEQLAQERYAAGVVPDSSGGYTVGGILASRWTDLLRARMVLNAAGVTTMQMDAGEVGIAKVTSDPVATWHGENAALVETQPNFGATRLKAKTVTTLVRFSVELAQDSSNIEAILQNTITNSLAAAIDSAGLQGVSTNAAIAPSGIYNLTGRNIVSGVGAPTNFDFMVDGLYQCLLNNVDQDDVGAFISHPRLQMKLMKLKTGLSGDNTPLVMPADLAAIPRLYTTANPITGTTTTKGVIGKWDDLIYGVRQQIGIRLLDQAFMGSNLQFGFVAFARVDFQAVRPASFTTLEGITVT